MNVTPPGNNNDSSGFEKLLEGALITLAGALSGNLAQIQYGWQITTKSNTIAMSVAENITSDAQKLPNQGFVQGGVKELQMLMQVDKGSMYLDIIMILL